MRGGAAKLGPIAAETEDEARAKGGLPPRGGLSVNWTYLRFVQDEQTKNWLPAAGTFLNWPARAKDIRFLDPCVGSGHFVAFALPLLARLRMEEEPLSATQAIYATLRDNIFALELDERCAQIAAFNVALTAWRCGGYQLLPSLHLACSGVAPHATEKDWMSLAGDEDRLRLGMGRLHDTFQRCTDAGQSYQSSRNGRRLARRGLSRAPATVGTSLGAGDEPTRRPMRWS